MSNIIVLAKKANIKGNLIEQIQALTALFKAGKIGTEQRAVATGETDAKTGKPTKKFVVTVDGREIEGSTALLEGAAEELGFVLARPAPFWVAKDELTKSAE